MSTENKNQPAFPVLPYRELEDDIKRGYPLGLTKREYFAAMAMQGLIMRDTVLTDTSIATKAVSFADALLKELNKNNGQ